jgi:toxin ParE1/3/4
MKLYERTAAIEDITHTIALIALDNPSAARKFYSAIRRSYLEIRRFPFIGVKRHFAEAGIRSWRVRGFPHLIFYKPGADRVEIVRVIHGAMDLERELGISGED